MKELKGVVYVFLKNSQCPSGTAPSSVEFITTVISLYWNVLNSGIL